jgi:hypothetical protein
VCHVTGPSLDPKPLVWLEGPAPRDAVLPLRRLCHRMSVSLSLARNPNLLLFSIRARLFNPFAGVEGVSSPASPLPAMSVGSIATIALGISRCSTSLDACDRRRCAECVGALSMKQSSHGHDTCAHVPSGPPPAAWWNPMHCRAMVLLPSSASSRGPKAWISVTHAASTALVYSNVAHVVSCVVVRVSILTAFSTTTCRFHLLPKNDRLWPDVLNRCSA